MCFGGREKEDSGVARSRELDKLIRQDEKRMSKEVKLLLLGEFLLLHWWPSSPPPRLVRNGESSPLLYLQLF
jgi:hypothetical protein